MGQYHYVLNFDKKEFLDPHRFGNGLQLMAFGTSSSGTLTGLTLLLAASNGRGGGDFNVETPHPLTAAVTGRWAGDRVAIVGDYCRDDDVPGFKRLKAVWRSATEERNGWVDISKAVVAVMRSAVYLRDVDTLKSDLTRAPDSQAYSAWVARELLRSKTG